MENDKYSLRWDMKNECVMVAYGNIERQAEDFIEFVEYDFNLPKLNAIFSLSINGNSTYEEFRKVARRIDSILGEREELQREKADYFNCRNSK